MFQAYCIICCVISLHPFILHFMAFTLFGTSTFLRVRSVRLDYHSTTARPDICRSLACWLLYAGHCVLIYGLQMHRLWSTISSRKHSCCLVRQHISFICNCVTVHQRSAAMLLVFSIVLPDTCNAGAASSCRSDFPLISISMLESGGRTRWQLTTLACVIGKTLQVLLAIDDGLLQMDHTTSKCCTRAFRKCHSALLMREPPLPHHFF